MQAELTLADLTPAAREGLARRAYHAYAGLGVALTEEVLSSARGLWVGTGAMFTMSDGQRVFGELLPIEAIDLPEIEDAA